MLSQEIATMHRDGFGPFFGLYVGADDMNSSMNIAQLYQGGLSLGSVSITWIMTITRRRFVRNLKSMWLKCSSWPGLLRKKLKSGKECDDSRDSFGREF